MWNFSASASRGPVKPSFGMSFMSSILEGSFCKNAPKTSFSVRV